jgi:hypothetical protein
MAILGVDDFKAKLRGGGARPNLFKATINFPAYANGDAELTSFLCKTAQLPGSQFGSIDVPFRGRVLKMAGDRTFETWTATIINDTDFAIRNAMERWSNGINAHSANTGLVSPITYEADLKIEQLDRNGDSLKTYTFRGAYPVNVGAIELDYGTADTIEEFTVEFNYQYWEALAPVPTTS